MTGRETVVCHLTSVHVATDARILYHECRSLARRYQTVLVCRDDDGPREIEGVKLDPLPRVNGRAARLLGGRELIRYAERLGASLYHFHDPELLPGMAELAQRTRVPVIYDAHEHYPDAMDQKAWLPPLLRPMVARHADKLERRLVPAMSAVVAADAALAERYRDMHARVVEVDNYPPLSLFGPALSSSPSDSPVSPGGPTPTMVYVGGISKHRGLAEMCEVLRLVRERVPAARLLLYGRPTEDAAEQLQTVADTMPPGAFEFRGPIDYGDLPRVFAECHVGLSLLRPHPKYDKNVSMKVFDYMAAGLPYVASDLAPLRAATGSSGGVLVPAADVHAAADAVVSLLGDEPARRRLGLQGRHTVEGRLNWESMEMRLFELYESLIGTARGSAMAVSPERGV